MKLKIEIALVKLNVADKQPELQTHNYDPYCSTG